MFAALKVKALEPPGELEVLLAGVLEPVPLLRQRSSDGKALPLARLAVAAD
ncbi:MAG: hypothetical protein WBW93_21785 [Steroidobacteraceae bacterium]